MCIEPPLPLEMPAARPVSSAMISFGIDAISEHVPVIAIAGDDAVLADGHRRLQPDSDRFLADVEVAEAADQPEAVELPRALLEAADEQHLAIELEQLVLATPCSAWAAAVARSRVRLGAAGAAAFFGGTRHGDLSQVEARAAYRWRCEGGNATGELVERDDDLVGADEPEVLANQLVGHVGVGLARVEKAPSDAGAAHAAVSMRRAPPDAA